jgi:hypothetical protein
MGLEDRRGQRLGCEGKREITVVRKEVRFMPSLPCIHRLQWYARGLCDVALRAQPTGRTMRAAQKEINQKGN